MKVKCTCSCHKDHGPGNYTNHIVPCCVDGFIEVPDPEDEKDKMPSTRDRRHNYRTDGLPSQGTDKHIDELK